ncbi:MAG TPA: glycerophosphodiester phosphodiesterase family protein [Flavisolibacter sp.]|nr:glycerophosphodiester phosphodiesterase family protein [Flavisolibacter sp.]
MFADNVVVAHRGAFKKNGLPENSIAALREAIRLKCTGSEFDVHMSADDVLLVNHDPHYAGLDIEKTTYQQLAATKLSNGEVLPTLREYLIEGLRNNTSTQLVLEIKPSASKERGRLIAERVMQLVKEMKAEKMVTYISFDYGILKRLEELDKTAITQYLNGEIPPRQLKADGIDGADYHFSVFKKHPEWIAEAKQEGILLNAWTVNEEADMQWLLSQKFDFITTNELELLFSILKK